MSYYTNSEREFSRKQLNDLTEKQVIEEIIQRLDGTWVGNIVLTLHPEEYEQAPSEFEGESDEFIIYGLFEGEASQSRAVTLHMKVEFGL